MGFMAGIFIWISVIAVINEIEPDLLGHLKYARSLLKTQGLDFFRSSGNFPQGFQGNGLIWGLFRTCTSNPSGEA